MGQSRFFNKRDYPIPKGFQIFEERLEVKGVSFRKNDSLAFVQAALLDVDVWLEFEREEDNAQDKNAIKIMGCWEGFWVTKKKHIGYMPKEVAQKILEGEFWGLVKPRLDIVRINNGYRDITFQLLGPRGKLFNFFDHNCAEKVETLKSLGKKEEVIALLLELVEKTENEAKRELEKEPKDRNIEKIFQPWYHIQLATFYREINQVREGIVLLQRCESLFNHQNFCFTTIGVEAVKKRLVSRGKS